MSFWRYERALKGELKSYESARSYYIQLAPELCGVDFEKPKNRNSISDSISSEHAYNRMLHEGQNHTEAVNLVCAQLRAQTYSRLESAKSRVFDRLTRIEKQYFKRLRKYKNRPAISFDTLSQEAIKDFRADQIQKFEALRQLSITNTLSKASLREWNSAVAKYKSGIDESKKLIKEMSTQIINWEKFVGDETRIILAIAALIVSLTALFVSIYNVASRTAETSHTVFAGSLLAPGHSPMCPSPAGTSPAPAAEANALP